MAEHKTKKTQRKQKASRQTEDDDDGDKDGKLIDGHGQRGDISTEK